MRKMVEPLHTVPCAKKRFIPLDSILRILEEGADYIPEMENGIIDRIGIIFMGMIPIWTSWLKPVTWNAH